MYKLSGHSLTKNVWFEPESQGMTLSERDSTTSITLGPDAPEIGFDEWILDDRWPEGNYVWRVKSLGDQTNTETRTTDLEHVIKILDDIKLFGEVTTADLAGQSGASTVTAKKAVQYILNKCSDWTLGTFEYDDVSNPYEFNGDSLYDALETITETLEDAVWTYSLGSYPFKLNIVHRSDAVACEMRAGRNLSTLKRQVNRSGMYTRIYPIGKNDLHIDGNYLSKNENLYGRIDQIETDQSKSTKANLRAWAQARLNRHCEPTMTITISGLELSADTGEDLDRLKLNRVCQCPLPNSSTVIDEKIVKLQWRDRLKEPENVTVNLCNSSSDVATIIKQQSRGGGKAAAGQAKQNYLFEANGQHLYYEIFDECGHLHGMLEMTSESLRIAFDNEIASTRSEFLMTSESLRIMFENEIASTRSEFEMTSESLRIAFENEIASTRSEFEMTSESLRIQFENDLASTRSEFQMTSESMRVHFENEISSTRSEMQMTSESLRIAFEAGQSSLRSEFNMTAASLRIEFQSADSSIRSLVTQTASSWEAKISGVTDSDGKVTAASIAVAINNAGEGVATINASKIYLLGQTIADQITADYISTKIATLSSLTVASMNCTGTIGASTVEVGTLKFRSSSGSGYSYSDLKDLFVTSVAVEGPVNNVYTLKYYTANGTGTSGGTFSRAVSEFTGTWSGNHYYVTVSPQGQSGVPVLRGRRMDGRIQENRPCLLFQRQHARGRADGGCQRQQHLRPGRGGRRKPLHPADNHAAGEPDQRADTAGIRCNHSAGHAAGEPDQRADAAGHRADGVRRSQQRRDGVLHSRHGDHLLQRRNHNEIRQRRYRDRNAEGEPDQRADAAGHRADGVRRSQQRRDGILHSRNSCYPVSGQRIQRDRARRFRFHTGDRKRGAFQAALLFRNTERHVV